MRMINELTADALDSQKFVDRIKAIQHQEVEQVTLMRERAAPLRGESYAGENRTQRRARERAERKAAMRAATIKGTA